MSNLVAWRVDLFRLVVSKYPVDGVYMEYPADVYPVLDLEKEHCFFESCEETQEVVHHSIGVVTSIPHIPLS